MKHSEMSWKWVLYQELQHYGPDYRLVSETKEGEWSIKQMSPTSDFWLFFDNRKIYDSRSMDCIFRFLDDYNPPKPKLKPNKSKLTTKSTWDIL